MMFLFSTYSFLIPRERTNPPSTKSRSNTSEPNVLATTMLLPTAAINRNIAEDIWLTIKSNKYCLKNLQQT